MDNRHFLLEFRYYKSKSEPFACYDKVVRIIRLWWAKVDSNLDDGFATP